MLDDKASKIIKKLAFAVLTGDLPKAEDIMSSVSIADVDKNKTLLFSFVGVENRNGKMTKLLLNKGVNPSVQAEDGYTALTLAVQAENMASMEHLLKSGVDAFAQFKGKTALDYARESNNRDAVTLLQDWEEKFKKSPAAKTARRRSLRSYINRKTI